MISLTDKMRVALCFPGCYRRGGIERVVLAVANGLADRGHEVSVFAIRAETDQLHPDVRFHCVDAPDLSGPRLLLRFPSMCERAMQEAGIDFDVTAGFGVACPRTDLAWVQSVHARWLEISRGAHGGGWKQRLCRRLNPFHPVAVAMEKRRFGAGGHGHLLALTEEVGRDLERFYKVPRGRWSILANGFDPEAFNPERVTALRSDARRRFGLGDNETVLSFVANESQRKGLPVLLEAVSRLGKADIKILAAGRLPEADVRAQAQALGVDDQLVMAGPIDDVTLAYAAGDIFVLPTVYEAWGLVIVEALACGLPVITSELAGAAEVIEHGGNGWLMKDPGDIDALLRYIQQSLSDSSMTAEDRSQSVAAYRWDRVIDQYEVLLRQAAGSQAG